MSNNNWRVGLIVASDKGHTGERKDESGPMMETLLKNYAFEVICTEIVPDEALLLSAKMVELCDEKYCDLVLTSGGTGFSKRDVTPEATLSVIEKETPGISEAIRYNSLQITPRAMLSRGISGIRNNSLIINLPGSPKAVKEILDYILPSIEHGLEILQGKASECARK